MPGSSSSASADSNCSIVAWHGLPPHRSLLGSRVYRLQREQFIPLPPDEVFAFFADAANLEAITPSELQFHILTPLPLRMQPDTLIDYRLRLMRVSFQWQTRIEAFDRPYQFIDTQARGPYRSWRHLHRFEATDGGTRMFDDVEYEMPYGPFGRLVHALFVRRALIRIFDYRRDKIADLLSPRRDKP